MRILYIYTLLLFLHGCSFQKSDISNIHVLNIASDSADAFCTDFSLTNSEAYNFIVKSREVDVDEFHNNYEYLPCYVKGTLNRGNTICDFTIRAGGTVELTCSNETGFLYVCDSCNHLLGERE